MGMFTLFFLNDGLKEQLKIIGWIKVCFQLAIFCLNLFTLCYFLSMARFFALNLFDKSIKFKVLLFCTLIVIIMANINDNVSPAILFSAWAQYDFGKDKTRLYDDKFLEINKV